MNRRLLALLAVVAAVLLSGAIAGAWLWWTSQPHSKVGSADVEFVPAEKPGRKPVVPTADNEIPWTTYGFDVERTHFAPDMRLRPPFRQVWKRLAGAYIEFPAVVKDGTVFVADLRGRIFATNAETGRIIWDRHYPNCAAASPTVVGDVLYETLIPAPCNYGPRDVPGLLIALDTRTGKEIWRFRGSGPSESSLLYVGGLLYFGAWDHKVYALDPKTRKVRWATETDAEINSSAVYSNGRIFIGTNGGSVYALNARTGEILWRGRSYSGFRFGHEYFYATPAVAYGRVFAPNTDGTLYVFGARSGDLLWAQPAGSYVYTAPAVWNQTVYVGSYDGKMYAFDAATGRLRWTYEASGSIHGAPTVMDGLVYFSVCGNCGRNGARDTKEGPPGTFALDARTGTLIWSFWDGRYSPVVADGKRVYIMGKARVWAVEPCPNRRSPDRTQPYRNFLKQC